MNRPGGSIVPKDARRKCEEQYYSNIMKKQFYFLIILALLVMLVAGIFLWSDFNKQAEESFPGVRFEPPENYIIKETSEGTIVENKIAGISFKVPDNWTADKEEIGIDEWIINILSPDVEVNESGLLIEGCGISSWIEYDKVRADIIRWRIEDPERFSAEISGGYESTEISSYPALKTVLENLEWGRSVSIAIPRGDKIYIFETRFLPEETGECSQLFEEFLKGISIF